MSNKGEDMESIIARGQAKWGEKFDSSELNPIFASYLHSGRRIAVKQAGEVWTGTVGVTTGWKPIFLLMARRDSMSSGNTLGRNTLLIATHDGRCYRDARGKRVRLQRSPETSIGAWVVANVE